MTFRRVVDSPPFKVAFAFGVGQAVHLLADATIPPVAFAVGAAELAVHVIDSVKEGREQKARDQAQLADTEEKQEIEADQAQLEEQLDQSLHDVDETIAAIAADRERLQTTDPEAAAKLPSDRDLKDLRYAAEAVVADAKSDIASVAHDTKADLGHVDLDHHLRTAEAEKFTPSARDAAQAKNDSLQQDQRANLLEQSRAQMDRVVSEATDQIRNLRGAVTDSERSTPQREMLHVMAERDVTRRETQTAWKDGRSLAHETRRAEGEIVDRYAEQCKQIGEREQKGAKEITASESEAIDATGRRQRHSTDWVADQKNLHAGSIDAQKAIAAHEAELAKGRIDSWKARELDGASRDKTVELSECRRGDQKHAVEAAAKVRHEAIENDATQAKDRIVRASAATPVDVKDPVAGRLDQEASAVLDRAASSQTTIQNQAIAGREQITALASKQMEKQSATADQHLDEVRKATQPDPTRAARQSGEVETLAKDQRTALTSTVSQQKQLMANQTNQLDRSEQNNLSKAAHEVSTIKQNLAPRQPGPATQAADREVADLQTKAAVRNEDYQKQMAGRAVERRQEAQVHQNPHQAKRQ